MRSIDMLEKYNGNIPHREQGILNYVISENKKLLHPKFNLQTSQLVFTYKQMLKYRKPYDCYSEEIYDEAIADPVIVHYTNNLFIQARPWMTGCSHPFNNEYLIYRSLIGLDSEQLQICNMSVIKKAARLFYRSFPGGFISWIGGGTAGISPADESLHR